VISVRVDGKRSTAGTGMMICGAEGEARGARVYFFAFLRADQYFFIRVLTAFRCAADIFDRVRLGSSVFATPRADLASVRRAVWEIVARSGNVLSNFAASV